MGFYISNHPLNEYANIFSELRINSYDQFYNSENKEGIIAGTIMSIQEKKKILRDQYRKWSDLVTSDDEKTRRKAELMLKIISQERSKLKEKNSQ